MRVNKFDPPLNRAPLRKESGELEYDNTKPRFIESSRNATELVVSESEGREEAKRSSSENGATRGYRGEVYS